MGITIKLLVLRYVNSIRGINQTLWEFNGSKICFKGCYTFFSLVIVVATRYFRAKLSNDVARTVCLLRQPQVLVNHEGFIAVKIFPEICIEIAYHICTLTGLLLDCACSILYLLKIKK